MKQKIFTARNCILLLLALLLSLCLAAGLRFAPVGAYALDAYTGEEEQPPEAEKDEDGRLINEWIVTPSIVSWQWKEFDKQLNTIQAKAKYGTETAVFRIFEQSGAIITYDNYVGTDENKAAFMLENDGLVPDFVAEKLNSLSVGRYYLHATIAQTDEYTALGVVGNVITNGYAFNVFGADSGWTTTPSIVSWTYKNFDRHVNVITAVPNYTDAGTAITYGVYTDPYANDSYAVAGLESFQTENNIFVEGKVSERTAELLNNLPAGLYFLRVRAAFGDTNYTALDTFVSFSVLQIHNYWQSTPAVVQWTWGEYDGEENVISANPAHAEGGAKVVYGVYTDELCNFSASGNNVLLNFTKVGETQHAALAALSAGTYWLKAELPATGNYSALKTVVSFKVLQNRNYWSTTPGVVQWTWGSFNAAENVFNAVPEYPVSGTAVSYSIYRDRDCKNLVEGLESFTAVDENVAKLLNALPADTYWLRARTYDFNANYADLDTTVSFRVLQARNVWKTSPYVIGWEYGEYKADFNLVYAQPLHGTAVFGVYTDEECTKPVKFTETYEGSDTVFALDEDGLVPEHARQTLNALGAGKYYLYASVAGNNDFTDINIANGVPVPFEVRALDNYWVSTPGVISWSEGHFGGKDLFSGAARFGTVKLGIIDSDEKLIYNVFITDGEITLVTKANGEHTGIDALNNLPVGSYTVTAEVAATDNYSALSTTATFAVFEDSVGLGGIVGAAIAFAVFDVVAAAVCITLLVIRRRKVEQQFRRMIRRELNRR